MTRKELREHCEKQIRVCETWSKSAGVPKGKIYEEHKLILELLERESVLDNAIIIPENATNVDIIKSMFSEPITTLISEHMGEVWCNAPYKRKEV